MLFWLLAFVEFVWIWLFICCALLVWYALGLFCLLFCNTGCWLGWVVCLCVFVFCLGGLWGVV